MGQLQRTDQYNLTNPSLRFWEQPILYHVRRKLQGGKFQLHFTGIEQTSYNLILNQIDVETKYSYRVYYSHQDVSELILYKSGYLQVKNSQGNISNLTSEGAVFKTDSYYRATLDFDGVFRFYAHPRLKLVSHLPTRH